jgi:hypothetical protein
MIASEYQLVAASSGGVLLTPLQQQEVLLARLDELYQLRNQDEVKGYLRLHDSAINVLLEAPERVKSHFQRDTQIALEVITDPEDGDRKLFAFALTPLPAEEAMDRLEQFDEEWWFEASERAEGQLIVDVEFIEWREAQETAQASRLRG